VSVVRLDGVSRRFGERRVLDGLTLSIDRGEVYGLLGPNGSGKSTAIGILCGLLAPDAGRVELRPAAPGRPARQALGVAGQAVALYPDLLPAETFDFFGRLYGLGRAERRRRIDELVGLFGLEPVLQTRVEVLSGGWRQRVHIATALVHSPDVLVLDEPTAAVDLEGRHGIWALIDAQRRLGTTILLTTHHLEEAERLCTRIGILHGGRIVREGSPEALKALVPARAIATVEAADPAGLAARAAALGWSARAHAGRTVLFLPVDLSLREVVGALDEVGLQSASVQPVTMEWAYLDALDRAR
jgi:ABC-2 type transport system ATP-binding protein